MKKREPVAGYSRYRETYDGPIITAREREKIADAVMKKYEWRKPIR